MPPNFVYKKGFSSRSSPPQEEWNDDEEDDRIGKCGMSGFVEHSGLVCIYALDFFAEQKLPIKKYLPKITKFLNLYYTIIWRIYGFYWNYCVGCLGT